MSMSVDGLVSGMDTTTIISQLMQAEAGPADRAEAELSATQTDASAYRTVNTTFAAVRAAAEALTASSLSDGRKASAARQHTAATATADAAPGSQLTFTVTSAAATHADVSQQRRVDLARRPTRARRTSRSAWPIEIRNADGTSRGTITLAGRRDARRGRRRHQRHRPRG